jgi:hypothetical protein
MQRPVRVNLLTLFAAIATIAIASGCGTTPPASSVIKTFNEVDGTAPFKNVLIISVAGEFPTRVRFEQELAAAFSGEGSVATANYTIVGRIAPLTRVTLNRVVEAREFDAIVLTRMKGQDRAGLIPNRPTGSGFNLYLYDYEELNIPVSIPTGSTVSFVVEVYDTRAKKKVWAIEALIFDSRSVESVVSDQVAAIAAEIMKDGLVLQ